MKLVLGNWQGGRPQPRRLCVRWGPSPLPKKGVEPCPQFSANVYCGQTAAWIKMPLGTEVGLGPDDIVLDGDTTEPPPQFSAHVYCGQTAECIKVALGMQVGLGPGHIVLDGKPASLPKRGRSPTQFSAHVYWGQTAAWIKMPLGTEVCLGLRDIVFDSDPAPPRKKAHPPHPIFGPCLLWPNGWMDEDATWCGSRPRPRPLCIRRVPSYPRKGHSSPPLFGPCLLWQRLPISATAELLLFKKSYKMEKKSSAVAEMGERGHSRHGPKRGGLLCPFRGSLDPV